jgi:hypothetical protein
MTDVPAPKRLSIAHDSTKERPLEDRILISGMFGMAQEMPEPEFIVSPVFIRGQMITVTARPGGGKSTILQTLAMSFARDISLGQLAPQSAGLCYFVSVEDAAGTAMRARAYRARHRLAPSQVEEIDRRLRWVLVEDVAPALIADRISTDAGEDDVDLVFIDTGVALFRGENENDNSEIQKFGAECRKWFAGLRGRPCVVILWHPIKGASADNLQPRGGSALTGLIDGNLTLWREDDHVTLDFTKLRGPQFDPIEFFLEQVTLELPSGRTWHVPIAVALGDEAAREKDTAGGKAREALLLALAALPDGYSASARELEKHVPFKKTKISETLAEMSRGRQPLVAQDELHGGYAATPAGRKRVAAIRSREAEAYRSSSNGA